MNIFEGITGGLYKQMSRMISERFLEGSSRNIWRSLEEIPDEIREGFYSVIDGRVPEKTS